MGKLFIASTGQNVGKTTSCLGLFSGLQKRIERLGFFKPVGQEWVESETGMMVDKDILLFRGRFKIDIPPELMSPVLLPSGFTRDFLNGKIDVGALKQEIQTAASKIQESTDFTLIEGTGHMGVGSIIDLNNAQVASLLNAPMVLVAPGGVGSSFDEIALNKALCDQHGVKLLGVILNKVKAEKLDMVQHYMEKALKRVGIPLLGCIPFNPFLSTPTLQDFETLFQTKLISGTHFRLFHFEKVKMVATSVEVFEKSLTEDQLIITHGAREEIILSTLSRLQEERVFALILTGHPPRKPILEQIKQSNIPCLITELDSFTTMKMISAYTAKIGAEDHEKIEEAINLVENQVNFTTLMG